MLDLYFHNEIIKRIDPIFWVDTPGLQPPKITNRTAGKEDFDLFAARTTVSDMIQDNMSYRNYRTVKTLCKYQSSWWMTQQNRLYMLKPRRLHTIRLIFQHFGLDLACTFLFILWCSLSASRTHAADSWEEVKAMDAIEGMSEEVQGPKIKSESKSSRQLTLSIIPVEILEIFKSIVTTSKCI